MNEIGTYTYWTTCQQRNKLLGMAVYRPGALPMAMVHHRARPGVAIIERYQVHASLVARNVQAVSPLHSK